MSRITPALVVLYATAVAPGAPGLWNVGHLELHPSFRTTTINAISGDGSTVVGGTRHGYTMQGIRWTLAEGIESLTDAPAGSFSHTVNACSHDGQTVVGMCANAGLVHGARWVGDAPPEFVSTQQTAYVNDTSASGEASSLTMQSQAYIWHTNGALDVLDGAWPVWVNAISADATRVVGYRAESETLRQAFVWIAGVGFVGLGYGPNGEETWANGISADGQTIVGGYGQYHAAAWTLAEGLRVLPALTPESWAVAKDASADGSVIIGRCFVAPPSTSDVEIVLWRDGGAPRRLTELLAEVGIDTSAWFLETVAGISDDGTVVAGSGYYYDPDFPGTIRDGFVARFPRSTLRGDANCDGAVTFADIDPFVLALAGPSDYDQAHPSCWWHNADRNDDGGVDFLDIDSFVDLLNSPLQ
jgi:uncharacterized membrane protein